MLQILDIISKVLNMSNITTRINLKGAIDLIRKSKYPLAPVYEAITNSFEAISQKQYEKGEERFIEIKFLFSGLLEETKDLQRIEISDNGLGFNNENYSRFETLLDKSKGYNNRGSGRIQYLHRVDKIEVSSIYEKENKKFKRQFQFDGQNYITNLTNDEVSLDSKTGSIVSLSGFVAAAQERDYFNSLEIKKIRNDVKKKFLLRFYLSKENKNLPAPIIKITFIMNEKILGEEKIGPTDIPDPQDAGEVNVPYVKIKDLKAEEIEWLPIFDKRETLKWAHFKLPADELEHNGVYLCSKNVEVEGINFREIKKNESINGYRYITAVYGEILNNESYVSHSVDSFKFPSQKEMERSAKEDLFFDPGQEFLFQENIHKEINEVIPKIYKNVLDLQKEQDKNIEAIALAHGIPIDVAKSANFNLADDERAITDKIYKKQAEKLSKENIKIKKLYETLNELNPAAENYHEELESKSAELLNLIPQQNKQELSRYVIRREMVTKILRLILDNNLSAQIVAQKNGKRRDNEALIHDLIFKRKSNDTGMLNDLWILNEEYVHFEGCSDLPINKIKNAAGELLLNNVSDEVLEGFKINKSRRPDIFLYAEEGKCILIELKAPDEDLSHHLNQLTGYSNLIANYSSKKIERFYCYLVGENINPIDIPGEYTRTVNEDWTKTNQPIKSVKNRMQDNTIANAHMEIIKLSSIHKRAHRRNKNFADKLGIRIEEN